MTRFFLLHATSSSLQWLSYESWDVHLDVHILVQILGLLAREKLYTITKSNEEEKIVVIGYRLQIHFVCNECLRMCLYELTTYYEGMHVYDQLILPLWVVEWEA